jgi:hypothetical protein
MLVAAPLSNFSLARFQRDPTRSHPRIFRDGIGQQAGALSLSTTLTCKDLKFSSVAGSVEERGRQVGIATGSTQGLLRLELIEAHNQRRV